MIFLPSVTWPFWTLGVETQDLPHYVLPLYTSPFDPPLGVPHLLHGNPNETLDRLHPIMAHPLVSTNVTVETPWFTTIILSELYGIPIQNDESASSYDLGDVPSHYERAKAWSNEKRHE